jgi:probable HAF family extracellular repeat protein
LRGGTFSFFDYPGAEATRAYGINDSGLIVGYAEFENDSSWLGFEYNGTTFTPIRDGNITATACLGLNNDGWVVGGDGTVYATKGFELRSGRFRTINFPGIYVYGYATGINNLGEVVGYTVDGLYTDAYRYDNGKFQNVDFPGASQTEAWGVNDSSVIVGWYSPMSAYLYAFVSKNRKYISFSYPGAVVTAAYGINTYGQIVGTYSLDNVTYHGFITSPLTAADFPADR